VKIQSLQSAKPRRLSPARPKTDTASPDTVILSTPKLPKGGRPRGGTLTGDIRSHRVRSENLGEKRKILVFLPPSYESEPNRNYKVLYTQDGQSVFDERTALHYSEWGLDEAAQRLMQKGEMEDIIIVAVSNGGSAQSRSRDYTSKADQRYGGGEADRYLNFLTDELKPMVDATYRTRKDPESTGILGSSLGGLFSLYAGFQSPDTFGLVGAMSPSLWYAGQDMLQRLQQGPTDAAKPDKIWLDMGTAEADSRWSLDPVGEFHRAEQAVTEMGYQPESNFFPRLIEGGEHTNEAWRNRAESFLRTMYSPEPV
jgi:predicted alpha/beta superfamily hydrolase